VSVHLTLHGSLVHLLGFGQATPPKGIIQVQLRDPGQLALIQLRHLKNRELLTIPITELELHTNNAQVSSGGGFIGGGVGIRGAITGIATASALNAMTRSRYEHTLLTAVQTLQNGARREATLAFATLSESQLRDQLAASIGPWADSYLDTVIHDPLDPLTAGDDLPGAYQQIDQMRHRGVLTPRQALTLASHASRPFVTALLARLDGRQIAFSEAQQLTTDITTLQREAHLDADQARQIHDRLLQIPAPSTDTPTSRIAQLQALAQLRETGALTEPEFQAEKTRLLNEPS
jgi:hypothetical protein